MKPRTTKRDEYSALTIEEAGKVASLMLDRPEFTHVRVDTSPVRVWAVWTEAGQKPQSIVIHTIGQAARRVGYTDGGM